MSTSQNATRFAKPVLYKDKISDLPGLPIPIQARFTLSPANTFPLDKIVGKTNAAESNELFFKNILREIMGEFVNS